MTGRETIDSFIREQLSSWPLAAKNFKALDDIEIKNLSIGSLDVAVQYNPARIASSVARTDSRSLSERPCFLCPRNRFPEQLSIPFRSSRGNAYDILLNPFPIFPDHLVIAMAKHTGQSVLGRFADILELSHEFSGYTFFYNGPKCGASAPDHHHFQACGSSRMPLEVSVDRSLEQGRNLERLISEGNTVLYRYCSFARGIFVISSDGILAAELLFKRLMDASMVPDGDIEPRLNLIVSYKDGEYRVIVIFRRSHRSHHYFSTGEDHFTMSPGAADMGGIFIVPKPDEFEKINSVYLSGILDEVTVPKEEEVMLIRRLTGVQQTVHVGIMSSETIDFEIIPDGKGRRRATISGGRIEYEGALYDELFFDAVSGKGLFSPPGFVLYGVSIGIGFHWERKEDQIFAGALRIIVSEGRLLAINEVGIEDYLLSVISSEMKASSGLELLKAHAVISRSWVMSMMAHNVRDSRPEACGDEIIRWYDQEDHTLFDVCADDHCQRYQGLTRAAGDNVRKAVLQTWGQTLIFEGQLCDARFSKCCGGVSETFATCWSEKDYPYLRSLPDTEGHETGGDPFCHTDDKEVLSQVLNDYDIETSDFYEWTVDLDTERVSDLVRRKSGIDVGEVTGLIPLERGGSGRIKRLRVVGSKSSFVIGKELEIRKILSDSHLRSSAFEVERNDNGFVLHGRGWGHGVGLCQIGAAVMASKGYNYKQILQHYYPDASVE